MRPPKTSATPTTRKPRSIGVKPRVTVVPPWYPNAPIVENGTNGYEHPEYYHPTIEQVQP